MEGLMRNVTFAIVLLVAATAAAQKKEAAVAAAKEAIDKADAAFNAHDAKALGAMLDKSYFGAGATVSAKADSPEIAVEQLTKMLARGGNMSRTAISIKAADDGATAWYIADYVFVPKVPPGALPVHRKMRESGVLVKRGKEWKFALTHMSMVQQDENPPVVPPTTAAPVQK
jgi:ketosteroid isomerase-like protein